MERSPGFRSILLSLALGLFSLKNITLTYFYLADDLPDINPLMFADVLVTGFILLRLLISGIMGSDKGGKENAQAAPHSETVRSEHADELQPTGEPLVTKEQQASGETPTAEQPPTIEEPPEV